MSRTQLAALLLVASSWPSSLIAQPAAPAQMVADLVETPLQFAFPYFPNLVFQSLGTVHLFAIDDGIHGTELWRTDGTSEGTWMVKDVCPGACTGVVSWDRHVADGLYYFPGNDGVHGVELWVSDGTTGGTHQVADLMPGNAGSSPAWIRSGAGRLFWTAGHPEGGTALWTFEGFDPVAVFRTDTSSLGPVIPVGGDYLLFMNDGLLWALDSSLVPVALHHDLLTVVGPTLPIPNIERKWIVERDRVFFEGATDSEGREPWVSDGTPAGTQPLGDLWPGPDDSSPRNFHRLGNEVVFRILDDNWTGELWAIDLATDALRRLFDPEELGIRVVSEVLASDGDRLLFAAQTTGTGIEPWITDGTPANTRLVEDVRPGSDSSLGETGFWYLPRLEAGPGRFLFPADDGVHGVEPWITDGTPEGTQLLADVNPDSTFPHSMAYVMGEVTWTGSEFLFAGLESFGGKEPWRSDGTPAGTRKLVDVFDQSSAFFSCFIPYSLQPCPALVPMGSRLFFSAFSEPPVGGEFSMEPRLHVTAGSPSSTRIIPFREEDGTDLQVYAPIWDPPAVAGDRIVVKPDYQRVWSTDGTEEGTFELVDFADSAKYPWLGPLVSFGGDVHFPANEKLWTTDGSLEGTLNLGAPSADFNSPPGAWPNRYLLAPHGLYWADEGAIWRMGPGFSPSPVAALPGTRVPEFMGFLALPPDVDHSFLVFFWYDDGVSGSEPWVLDAEGAHPIVDLRPGPSGSRVRYTRDLFTEDPGIYHLAAATEDLVFFVADDGSSGSTLWRSNGTAAGTRTVSSSDGTPLRPLWLTSAGDGVYFAAELPGHGRELWFSDGSDPGTDMLEIVTGEVSSVPRHFRFADQALIFAAFHPWSGVELWTSDGTLPNTRLFQDLNPGVGSSSPTSLTVGDRRLWFTANDGVHGFELWSAPLDIGIFADDFESGDLALWSLSIE